MDRETFYDRFSTSAKSSLVAERESFHGRFSTSKRRGENPDIVGGSWELLIMLVIAFDLVFGVLRPFAAEPMRVPSESMAPTLQVQDRVLINKLAYDFASPERGDLVVFESVETTDNEDVVKRVAGLSGDEVAIENGVLLVNGEVPYEPYAASQSTLDSFNPVIIPKDHIFVLGDNRANSYDSRFFGPVPYENLLGEASFRFWPLNRLGAP